MLNRKCVVLLAVAGLTAACDKDEDLRGYTPMPVGWVGRLDGFSDTGFLPLDSPIDAATDGTGMYILAPPARYELYVYGNYKKATGANAVSFEFCFTVAGVCAGIPQLVTVPNAVNYVVSLAVVDLATILPGITYGFAVRNITNSDDIIMRNAFLRLAKR